MKTFQKDMLTVKVSEKRIQMGQVSATDVETCIEKLLTNKQEINMIFAAAPSQNDFLKNFINSKKIDFERINAFHMDEYVGLSQDTPQCFSNFLRTRLFDLCPFKSVNYINGQNDASAECERYSQLLINNPVDIVCLGIGENGHLAFNDPHVADFNDSALVKIVELDDACRQQQVNDGCFENIDFVPKTAITLTIPALMKANYHFCIVPASTKAKAVSRTMMEEISEKCPSTILRRAKNAIMYLDADSSKLCEI